MLLDKIARKKLPQISKWDQKSNICPIKGRRAFWLVDELWSGELAKCSVTAFVFAVRVMITRHRTNQMMRTRTFFLLDEQSSVIKIKKLRKYFIVTIIRLGRSISTPFVLHVRNHVEQKLDLAKSFTKKWLVESSLLKVAGHRLKETDEKWGWIFDLFRGNNSFLLIFVDFGKFWNSSDT